MAYGNNRECQLILWGEEDSTRAPTVDVSLQQSTAIINAYLNYKEELPSPTDSINTCCNLIAAGLISTRENATTSPLLEQGQLLLERITNDLPTNEKRDYTRVFQQEW